MSNFFELSESLQKAIENLNVILKGDENATVDIDGETKNSISRETKQVIDNLHQEVLGAASAGSRLIYQLASEGQEDPNLNIGDYFWVASSEDSVVLELWKKGLGSPTYAQKSTPSKKSIYKSLTLELNRVYSGGYWDSSNKRLIVTNESADIWSGPIKINGKSTISMSGLVDGDRTAAFFDASFEQIGSHMFNGNSVIKASDIPDSAEFFAFSLSRTLFLQSINNISVSQDVNAVNHNGSTDLVSYKDGLSYVDGEFLSVTGVYAASQNVASTRLLPLEPNMNIKVLGLPENLGDTMAKGILFFDTQRNFISHVPIKNKAVKQDDIPESAVYFALNLKSISSEVDGVDSSSVTQTSFLESKFQVDAAYGETINYKLGSPYLSGKYWNSQFFIIESSTANMSMKYPILDDCNIVVSGRKNISSQASRSILFFDSAQNLVGTEVLQGLESPFNGVVRNSSIPESARFFSLNISTVDKDSTESLLVKQVSFVDLVDSVSLRLFGDGSAYSAGYAVPGNSGVFPAQIDKYSFWSGMIPIPKADGYFSFENFESNLLSVYFYDEFGSQIGDVYLDYSNDPIYKEDIPDKAIYIARNIKYDSYDSNFDKFPSISFVLNKKSGSAIETGEYLSPLELVLPRFIPVAVGHQLNIYTDNIRNNPVNDKTVELFIYEGERPMSNQTDPFIYSTRQTERAIQWLPTAAGQTEYLTILARKDGYKVTNNAKTKLLSVSTTNGNGRQKFCLLCGDSQIDTTYDGAKTSFAPFLKDYFEQSGDMDMRFVGSQYLNETIYDIDDANNRDVSCPTEAYGGKTIDFFLGAESPFWNESKVGGAGIDFENWISERAASAVPQGLEVGEQLDYFVFPMGVNDWIQGASISETIDKLKSMYAILQNQQPNCKFIICLPTQGSKFWSMDARRKWNIDYYKALIDEFEKREYSGKAYIAANGIWTDNIFGSRQVRPFREPYKRIVDSKNLLINKLVQERGISSLEAKSIVEQEWGFKVEERVLERWTDEFPTNTDIVHSSWVSAYQQADCVYSMLRYLLEIEPI